MDGNTKVCSKCKIEYNFSLFYKLKLSKDGFQSYCKNCKKIYESIRGIDKKRKPIKKWKMINKEKYKNYCDQYNKSYREKNKEKIKKYAIKKIENLEDYYVRSTFKTNLKTKDIPIEIINTKRLLIKLKRELRKL